MEKSAHGIHLSVSWVSGGNSDAAAQLIHVHQSHRKGHDSTRILHSYDPSRPTTRLLSQSLHQPNTQENGLSSQQRLRPVQLYRSLVQKQFLLVPIQAQIR